MNEINRVECRMRGDTYFLVCLLFVMALFFGAALFLPTINTNDKLIFAAFSLFFTLAGLVAFWLIKKTFVLASQSGLHVSNGRGSVELHWEEITDYYQQKRGKYLVAHLEARGQTWAFNHALTNYAELQDAIQKNAVASRAKEWQLFGTRTFDEWSRTFRYKDTNPLWTWLFVFGTTFLLLVLVIGEPLLRGGWNNIGNNFANHYFGLSPLMIAAMWLIILLVFGSVPFLVVAVTHPRIKASRAYLQHTVTADLRGLTFQTPQENTPIAWDRVLDYYLEPVPGALQSANRCVVVTARGESAFLSTIVDGFILREIIKTYATNAQAKEWASKPGHDRDNLKTPAQFQAAAGTKVFHFRTRTARAMLWLLTSFITLLPVATAARYYVAGMAIKSTQSMALSVICNVVLSVALFLVWICYLKTHIILDEYGITTRGLRSSRFIAWTKIESYEVGSDGYFLAIKGAGQKIRILQMFSDVADFKNEVQRRAANSKNRGWKQTQ